MKCPQNNFTTVIVILDRFNSPLLEIENIKICFENEFDLRSSLQRGCSGVHLAQLVPIINPHLTKKLLKSRDDIRFVRQTLRK